MAKVTEKSLKARCTELNLGPLKNTTFGIRFNRLDGVDFGASLGKMTGLFWMAISLLTDIVLNMELGGFASALVFFIPAWISAAAWKRELISLQ